MAYRKSIDPIPDFEAEDIQRRFTLWLQRGCREKPNFLREISDFTGASEDTVKRWRKGHPAGFETMLHALARSGGPGAINAVILRSMGMTGARWVDDTADGGVRTAQREIEDVATQISEHPPSHEVFDTTRALGNLMRSVTKLMNHLNEETAARFERFKPHENSADILEMPERPRRMK